MSTLLSPSRLIAFVLLLLSSVSYAIDDTRLEAETLTFAGIDLSALDITFQFAEKDLILNASADELIVAGETLSDVNFSCRNIILNSGTWHCQQGLLGFTDPLIGKQKLQVSFSINPQTSGYLVEISQLHIGEGTASISLMLVGSDWQAKLYPKSVGIAQLLSLASQKINVKQLSVINQWQPQAVVSGELLLSGQDTTITSADIKLKAEQLHFSNETGDKVAEALSMQIKANADLQNKAWQFEVDASLDDGQSYWAPIFLDFQQVPLMLKATGNVVTDTLAIDLQHFDITQPEVMTLKGNMTFAEQQLRAINMKLGDSPLAALYQWWLQPFVPGTAVANLNTDGQISGQMSFSEDELTLQANLNQVKIEDANQRFALLGLEGELAWTTGSKSLPIDITWQQLNVGPVPISASRLQASVSENRLMASTALSLPILDGGLLINDFNYQRAQDGASWQFDGLIKPLSMQALTNTLGWPEMDGKLSGVIPKVSYQKQQVDIDGALLVKVFDGTAVIKDLTMRNPLGSLPQLSANIDLQRLDLEQLTSTFDFGKITGRLDGEVTGLQLINWQPVQFDAHFATPIENPGKRRISQRAVDNLSQIGGGASGVMSRSFLRFFEDFSYEKLGIRCRLFNEVCQMSGVADDDQGYYIVKGGGLPPWINVKGYTDKVDWPELLARLQAVRHSEGPVIE